MLIRLNEQSMQNLIVFLDRVDLKGHKERQAMNEIEIALLNPIPEQTEEATTVKEG